MYELLSILAVWKITVMLMQYDGPLDIIKWFRVNVNNYQTKRKILNFNCLFCLSTVVALPFALYLADGWPVIIYWFGISGGAYFLDAVVDVL